MNIKKDKQKARVLNTSEGQEKQKKRFVELNKKNKGKKKSTSENWQPSESMMKSILRRIKHTRNEPALIEGDLFEKERVIECTNEKRAQMRKELSEYPEVEEFWNMMDKIPSYESKKKQLKVVWAKEFLKRKVGIYSTRI